MKSFNWYNCVYDWILDFWKVNDANNLDSLNPEEVKNKFPNVDSKRLSKVNVLKHISVDIIGSNHQLID